MSQNSNPPQLEWPRARVQDIQNALIELIIRDGLGEGTALPPEAELSEALGVGRNSLREAVKALQALGVLTIRHGSGTFVAEPNLSALTLLLSFRARHSMRTSGREAQQLVEVREALEIGLLPHAMHASGEADLAAVRSALSHMEAAPLGDQLRAADMAFHESLFAPLRNDLLSQVLRAFWVAYNDIADLVQETTVDRLETVAKHQAILDAVESGNEADAVVAMRDHFTEIRERIHALEV
ncbi:FadR family transcriptional regulator [Ruania alkalisoli]|uniref:FadR family transcriptional regulator n=1 Tax=Ruania alkalisoli TaxID=2779775 RepID=A0A7M1SSV0_9MICO|nr:FadR/GntR family transcriptional regulator [Ruania alkalisoli]QOR70565.1 FadR family transcriptional regulator [Ruania alkalisoli]